jgi:hypothetical protein
MEIQAYLLFEAVGHLFKMPFTPSVGRLQSCESSVGAWLFPRSNARLLGQDITLFHLRADATNCLSGCQRYDQPALIG